MNFHNSNTTLHLAWLLPMIFLFLYVGSRKRKERVALFISDSNLASYLTTNVSTIKRRSRDILFILGILFVVIALAGPYWGTKLVKRPSHSRDLLVVMDCSRSMLATDISPSRLKHAKWFIRELMERTPGDRYGVIAFSGAAFLECPLTQDRNGLLLFLEDIDTDTIQVGGTNIEEALQTAVEAFKAAEGNHRAIVLITDGDELQGDSSLILDKLKEKKIPIFAVGIGDPRLGSFIQTEGNKFITDKKGDRVKTKLNEASLRKIAETVGGTYVHSTAVHDGIDHVAQKVKALIPEEQEENSISKPIERYQIPLFIGFLFLLLRMVIGERKPVPKIKPSNARTSVTLLLGIVIQLVWNPTLWDTLFPQLYADGTESLSHEDKPDHSDDSETNSPKVIAPQFIPPKKGFGSPLSSSKTAPPRSSFDSPELGEEKIALIKKSIQSLNERIDKTKDPLELGFLHYNLGVNYHLLGQREQAETEYNKALDVQSGSNELAAAIYQNLGVLKHLRARENFTIKPDDALKNLKEAQENYREAMRQNPKLDTAAQNQELVLRERKLIEEFKKMKDELGDLTNNAQEATKDALDAQQEANKEQDPAEKMEKQTEALDKTEDAKKAANQLEKATNNLGQESAAEWIKQAGEYLENAINEQQNAMNSLPNSEETENEDSSEKAEEFISQALRQLGSEAKEEEDQEIGDTENRDQKQESDQEQPSKDGDQDAESQLDEKINMAENDSDNKGENQPELQDFDKLQSLRILDDLQENEKDLKQELKKLQKQNRQLKEVDKNW